MLALASCGSSEEAASTPPASRLTVFAASSLRSTFTELGKKFEAEHPGTSVRFNFAGSADLVSQLQQGAPGDVFASADAANMDKAAADKLLAGSATAFATNSMIIAVPPNNPAHITTFADLAKPGVEVVICAPTVPCGAATKKVESNTGVTLAPVSEESSVVDVRNKVATGEADAGVVYVTEAMGSAGKVVGIAIAGKLNVTNRYPIAVTTSSHSPRLAADFQAFVLGTNGQQVLAEAGFGPA